MPGSWILAVDFGTTNTAAAIRFPDGRLEKVKLDPGSDTMPSAVVLTDGQWRVGRAALNARWSHPQMFVASPKTRLGQEPVLLGDSLVDPAQIASVVLAAVRERASAAAGGGAPDRLVLTHPARWGQARLAALREAARLGGFPTDSVRLVSEPIAALHAHVQPGSLPPGSRVVVVDTGGGTCDVAVLHVTDNPAPGKDLLIVAQEGDERLGGNDLDDLLYQWVISQLNAHGRADLVAALRDPAHHDAAMTLLDMVRAAKQDLSEHADAPVAVSVAGQKVTLTITRDEYEQLIAEPVARAAGLTARALTASGTTQIAGLYLTGGTAYTPALARALHQVTGILTAPIGDPKLVVALGALRTPTAVMSPSQLHQLTQQLKADRIQQALTTNGPSSASHSTQTAPAPPPPSPSNPRPNSRRKVLATVLAALLIVGTAGTLAIGANRGWFWAADPGSTTSSTPQPTTTPHTCWDGTDNEFCPARTSDKAVRHAFTPPDPDQCQKGSSDVDVGLFYHNDCSADRRYKPYTAYLQLWADTDAIKAYMDDENYESTSTWKNDDGMTVGTTYTGGNSFTANYSSDVLVGYCYDEIPFCLWADDKSVFEEFDTLSTDQIRDVAASIRAKPIPDPTENWDSQKAESAFPAADGAVPLTCKAGNLTGYADEQYNCQWSDDENASVTAWSSSEDAIEYYRGVDNGSVEPWIVDGAERGTTISGGNLEGGQRWCYSDISYCIMIYDKPDELMARIAPLTEEQAKDF